MKFTTTLASILAVGAIGFTSLAPSLAYADRKPAKQNKKKNDRHDNGLHLGWYKNNNPRNDRWEDNRRRDNDRRDSNRWDDRWDRDSNRRYDDWRSRESDRRQDTKNEWRNLGYAAAALGVYGLIKGNDTLTLIGLGGALYSAQRYEQDRKSQNSLDRRRAEFFSQRECYIDGNRYVRREVTQNGKKYYRFDRSR